MHIDEFISTETETFHEVLRSCVSIFLILIILLIVSHVIISRLKIKQTDDRYFINRNDRCAYQVALVVCTFSVSITLAVVFLLPISIISNEIVLKYPKSYYMQWINTSLIQNLWNTVSLSSNIIIFILMPFSTFFLDSEGFSGMRSNIHNRMMEAICFLMVMIFLVLGVVWVLCIPFRDNQSITSSLRDLWQFYLPLVYSTVSLFGVVLLCILSPLGCLNLLIALLSLLQQTYLNKDLVAGDATENAVELAYASRCSSIGRDNKFKFHIASNGRFVREKYSPKSQISKHRYVVEIIALLLLLVATVALVVLLVFYVVVNIVGTIAGLYAMPQSRSHFQLGQYPSSTFGWFGTSLQIILIFSLLISSIFALYRVSPMKGCLPQFYNTDIHTLMKNAMCLLLVCSASPIQSRLLGVTVFNPLGMFGRVDWLDSGVLVLTYNVGFLVLLGLWTFREIVRISFHRKVVVNSVREVITYTSPTVVKILSNNIRQKNYMKTA